MLQDLQVHAESLDRCKAVKTCTRLCFYERACISVSCSGVAFDAAERGTTSVCDFDYMGVVA